MGAEHAHRLVAIMLDEFLARLDAHRGVRIEGANPVRMRDLNRMMHHVAGDDGVLAARRDPHTDVTGSVARGGFKPDLAREPAAGLDQFREPRVDHRTHRVFESVT